MTHQILDTDPQEQLAAIEAFESETGYDASYMKEMLEHAPEALAVFNGFIPMASYRKHAPLQHYYVAKLTAYRHCDCGPCLQLAFDYARQDGVPLAIREAIAFQRGELDSDLERVRAFTLAVLRNEPECEELRQSLEFEIGKAAVVEIALAIAAPQIFPVVKRATGHYKSCSMVSLELRDQ